jgi:hypothetical protein
LDGHSESLGSTLKTKQNDYRAEAVNPRQKERYNMSYQESKTTLNKIRDDYSCKGDILFKTALQVVVESGQHLLQDALWVQTQISAINAKHNVAEQEGKILFIGRDFEVAIVECAAKIAKIPVMDLLQYVQKEIWLSGEGMDYQRAIELLKRCMGQIEANEDYDHTEMLNVFYSLEFQDYEIEELGYGWLFEEEEE